MYSACDDSSLNTSNRSPCVRLKERDSKSGRILVDLEASRLGIVRSHQRQGMEGGEREIMNEAVMS